MTRTLDPTGEDRPTGPVSSLMYEYSRQIHSIKRHADAEGLTVRPRTTLASYDRALHPWLHGRRPPQIAAHLRTWWRGVRGRLAD